MTANEQNTRRVHGDWEKNRRGISVPQDYSSREIRINTVGIARDIANNLNSYYGSDGVRGNPNHILIFWNILLTDITNFIQKRIEKYEQGESVDEIKRF